MGFAEYPTLDGLALAELIARKEVSASEVVDSAIARAEALNPKLNAIVFKDFDAARKQAATTPLAPFHGVPTLLKDMSAGAKGMPTRLGSAMTPARPADHDSVVVARLRAAGIVPLGKTNVPEFGILPTTESKLYGAARNPWNLAHSTGGSSGGSAAAVAAGIVPFAHATDGGGSIRIPASCNGLVGLKVSRGRVSQGPDGTDRLLGLSVDHVVSRSVRDSAALLDLFAVPDFGDPYFALPAPSSYLAALREPGRRLRIAMSCRLPDGRPLHSEIEAAIRNTAKLCEDLGHRVEEASPVIDHDLMVKAFMTLWAAGTAFGVESLARATGQTPSTEILEGLTFALHQRGLGISAVEQSWAQQSLYMSARTAARFHETYDLWLSPVLSAPPMKLGTIDVDEQDLQKAFAPIIDYAPFTAAMNGTGQPAISLPLHWTEDGLPVGVQFVARHSSEMLLLQFAAELEEAAAWSSRRPVI